MTHRRMLVLPILAALALPADGLAAERVALRAKLVSCEGGARSADRAVVFQGSMPRSRGAVRLQMRFTLLQRIPGDPDGYERVAVPGWDRWETSERGRPGFVFTKRVEALLAPAYYRATVRFRWLDARGRVVRRARRRTTTCVQRDPRPNLRLARAFWAEGRWRVEVENTGRSEAPAFSVGAGVVGAEPREVRAEALAPGDRIVVAVDAPCMPGDIMRFTLDPAGDLAEVSEDDNVLELPCG